MRKRALGEGDNMNDIRRSIFRARGGFAFLAGLLGLTFAVAAAAAETQTEYFAFLFDGRKIGHLVRHTTADAEGAKVEEISRMQLRQGSTEILILKRQVIESDSEGRLRQFELEKTSGSNTLHLRGERDADGRVQVEIRTAAGAQRRTLAVPPDAVAGHGAVLARRRLRLQPGATGALRSFEPESLAVKTIEFKADRRERIAVPGREIEALRVDVTVRGAGAPVSAVAYYDAEYREWREEMSVMGGTLALVRCDEAFALGDAGESLDVAGALILLDSPRPLPHDARSVTLTIRSRTGAAFPFPQTDGQRVAAFPGDGVQLSVARAPVRAQPLPYAGRDAAALAALRPTRYVESDNEDIVALARSLTDGVTDAARAIPVLANWVRRNVISDSSVPYASAAETLKTRRGDCTEKAVLLAALCRAVGIPARLANGLMYVSRHAGRTDVFAGHQWTQVYLDGVWVDVDATLPSPYYSAARITMATVLGDDNTEWQGLGELLRRGQFEIADAEFAR